MADVASLLPLFIDILFRKRLPTLLPLNIPVCIILGQSHGNSQRSIMPDRLASGSDSDGLTLSTPKLMTNDKMYFSCGYLSYSHEGHFYSRWQTVSYVGRVHIREKPF
jgi:hypothetical protein